MLISPQSASAVEAENRRIAHIFLANLERYPDGRPLLNRFDRFPGY